MGKSKKHEQMNAQMMNVASSEAGIESFVEPTIEEVATMIDHEPTAEEIQAVEAELAMDKEFGELPVDTVDEVVNDGLVTSVEPTMTVGENESPTEQTVASTEVKPVIEVNPNAINVVGRTVTFANRNASRIEAKEEEGITLPTTITVHCTVLENNSGIDLDLVTLGLFAGSPKFISKTTLYDFMRQWGVCSTLVSKTNPSWFANGNMFSEAKRSRMDGASLKPLDRIESSLYGCSNLHTYLSKVKQVQVGQDVYVYSNFTYTKKEEVKNLTRA